jgi:hypothetical protein
MTYHIDGLRRMSEAHRNRANMTKLSEMLDNLEETSELLQPWLEKAAELYELLNEFGDLTEQLPEETLAKGTQEKLLDEIDVMLRFVPERSSNAAQLSEFHEAAKDRLSDLDDSMEDRNYSAEDRDTMWYEAADAAGSMALALEEIESLGTDPDEEQPGEG